MAHLLQRAIPEYGDYRCRTKKFVPLTWQPLPWTTTGSPTLRTCARPRRRTRCWRKTAHETCWGTTEQGGRRCRMAEVSLRYFNRRRRAPINASRQLRAECRTNSVAVQRDNKCGVVYWISRRQPLGTVDREPVFASARSGQALDGLQVEAPRGAYWAARRGT
jgi:hypothetical protein